MYCNTPQVNQLTSLLKAHHIEHVVVCPGSRNATIVHNLHAAGSECFKLHPVTDERSAAFVALGMVLATQEAVAVCVTSGSALLGCIPAAAEAYYRHLPLLVISADRPQYIIGQLDGQTLPQNGALSPYCPTFNITEPHNNNEAWCNNRKINEALLALHLYEGQPVHINVEIEEPMFNFSTPQLPQERVVQRFAQNTNAATPLPDCVLQTIAQAKLPTLVMGQYERGDIRKEVEDLRANNQMLVLSEIISDVSGNHLMEAFDEETLTPYVQPDVIVHIGGNFVHKKFKKRLRNGNCMVIRVGNDAQLPDTFYHTTYWLQQSVQPMLAQLAQTLKHNHTEVKKARASLENTWQQMQQTLQDADNKTEGISMYKALNALYQHLLQHPDLSVSLHLANSSAVRVAGKVFQAGTFPIYCNRGTNGIEGSLSTAVGYALTLWGLTIVVIGDLSFFYDVNALWNMQLPNNLRIMLLNNGRGSIFDHLPGLSQSPAQSHYIAAGDQHYTAQGIAQAFKLNYHSISVPHQLNTTIAQWLKESDRASLLEVELPH